MKKFLLLSVVLLSAATALTQEVSKVREMKNFQVLDPKFNGDLFFLEEGSSLCDDSEMNITYYPPTDFLIYDKAFNLVKTIKETPLEYSITENGIPQSGFMSPFIEFDELYDVEDACYTGSATHYVTQTFFNDDDKWEYLLYDIVNTESKTVDNWGDEHIYTGSHTNGVKLVQDDGTILANIPVLLHPVLGYRDFYISALKSNKMPGIYYFIVEIGYTYTIYSWDCTSTSVQEVKSIGSITAWPNPVGRSETLNMGLPKANDASAMRNIAVTSMAGKVVYQQAVQAEDTQVKISLKGLTQGVYNFTLYEGGKVITTNKIVVK